VWDWQAGKTSRTIRGQAGEDGKIYAMALSPDGRWLVSGGLTKDAIRLYDFATGDLVSLLNGHTNAVNSLAFSFDSKRLISGSYDATAIIWDVENRQLVHRLKGHKEFIFSVAFTPDGQWAVTGSDDTTVRLWRVSDGKQITILKGHNNQVRSLAIRTSDGMIAGSRSSPRKLTPVTLPPGRARLATRLSATGSLAIEKTIGIVEVARLAARIGSDATDPRTYCAQTLRTPVEPPLH
jgi:WD40 repeat protein